GGAAATPVPAARSTTWMQARSCGEGHRLSVVPSLRRPMLEDVEPPVRVVPPPGQGVAMRARTSLALVGSAHPGPALAVTVLAALLATALEMSASRVLLVTAAVLCGQL